MEMNRAERHEGNENGTVRNSISEAIKQTESLYTRRTNVQSRKILIGRDVERAKKKTKKKKLRRAFSSLCVSQENDCVGTILKKIIK